jgi:hypothetical protein
MHTRTCRCRHHTNALDGGREEVRECHGLGGIADSAVAGVKEAQICPSRERAVARKQYVSTAQQTHRVKRRQSREKGKGQQLARA